MLSIDKGKLIDQAQKFAQKGQLDKAIAEYQKVIEADPRDSRILLKIGELHLKRGNKAAAISEYLKAGENYSLESFNLQAIAVYKQLLKIDPSISDVYIKLADLYGKQGLIADAIAQYRIVINNFEKEGKVAEAIDALKKMASMDPENFSIRAKLAELYFKSEKRRDALDEYARIADALKKKGRVDDVIILYEKLLSADPSCSEAHRELGDAYLKVGKKEAALKSLESALTLEPDDTKAMFLLAEAYMELENLQGARRTYEDILRIDPSSAEARRGISRILIKEGNNEEGINAILPVVDKAIGEGSYDYALSILLEFYRNDVVERSVLDRMANVYRLKGETDKEIEVRRELDGIYGSGEVAVPEATEKVDLKLPEEQIEEPAVEMEFIQPDEVPAEAQGEEVSRYLTEAEVYQKYGIKDKAIEVLEAALRINPGHKEVLNMLKSLREEHPEEIVPEAEEVLAEVEPVEEVPELEIEEEITLEMSDGEAVSAGGEQHAPSKIAEYLEESDFYFQQGLLDEAKAVCNRILESYPGNEDVLRKLKEIEEAVQSGAVVQTPATQEVGGEGLFDLAAELEGENFDILTMPAGMKEAEKFGFEDIFSEFKKGVETQLEKEDSETHYNLGMAYKEMGLMDDAIREFKISAADSAREFDSLNLIGICLVESGNHQKAIEVFKRGIGLPNRSKDEYASMNYDLGAAFEQCGMMAEALAAFTEANNHVPGFRDVAGKIASLGGGREGRKGRVSYI